MNGPLNYFFLTACKANFLSLLVLANAGKDHSSPPFSVKMHILKEGHILFWFVFNIKDSLSTTVLCLMQVKAFSAYPKFKNFILCGCSVYRVTSQPFSLTYLYSMVQKLKSTCIPKNTPLQVVFSTFFSVIDLWSNTVSCLIYYLKYFLFKDVFKRHFGDQK